LTTPCPKIKEKKGFSAYSSIKLIVIKRFDPEDVFGPGHGMKKLSGE
jgi:hypothetical protein